jgi:hypothetical protein
MSGCYHFATQLGSTGHDGAVLSRTPRGRIANIYGRSETSRYGAGQGQANFKTAAFNRSATLPFGISMRDDANHCKVARQSASGGGLPLC